MLSSASVSLSFEKFGEAYYYVKHQVIFGLIPGIVFLIVLAFIDYRFWRDLQARA